MNFPYSTVIVRDSRTGDYLMSRRPEIAIEISGPKGSGSYFGLVDTGSDHTIVPWSLADSLGLPLQPADTIDAQVFGGAPVELLSAQAMLKVSSGEETALWTADVRVFRFPHDEDETLILGHASFLEFFTATFDGDLLELSLDANWRMPGTQP